MPSKRVLAVVVGLVVIALLVIVSDYVRDRPVIDDVRIGKPLVSDDVAAKTSKIVITKGAQSVTLTRDDAGRWMVAGETPFAASGKMVSSLIDSLTGAKCVRLVAGAKEKVDALEINKGDKIALFDHDTPLAEVRIGKSRQGSGEGEYVSLGGEDKAFLIDKHLSLEATSAQWELKALPDLPKDQISKVSYFSKADAATPELVVARAKKEEPMKLEGMAASDKANQGELDAASSILTGVNFKNRLRPDALDAKLWSGAARTVVETFDGRQFTVKIASEQKKLPPLPPPQAAPEKPGEKKKPQSPPPGPRIETNYYVMIEAKGTENGSGDVAFINGLGKMWVFQLDEYVAKRFIKERTAFLDKP